MTTKTQTITTIELTLEERRELRTSWSAHIATKSATAADMVVYSLLRGKPAARGFTPITNPVKLANGHAPWLGLTSALFDVSWLADNPARALNSCPGKLLTKLFPEMALERKLGLCQQLGALANQQADKTRRGV